jgi:hypothetical protein
VVDLSCSKAIKRSNNCYRTIANWAAVFRGAKRSLLAIASFRIETCRIAKGSSVLLGFGVLLVIGARSQIPSLARQEYGQTTPFAVIAARSFALNTSLFLEVTDQEWGSAKCTKHLRCPCARIAVIVASKGIQEVD